MTFMLGSSRLGVACAVAVVLCLSPFSAEAVEPLTLTIEEAVDRAVRLGETAALAREGVAAAEVQAVQARAGTLPQLDASLIYERTLASVFDVDLPPADLPDPEQEPPPEAPALDLQTLLGDLPFGRTNTWILSLQAGQVLYAGGRLAAAREAADGGVRAGRLAVEETDAAIARDVGEAYFGAVLAAAVVEISEEALRLAEAHLDRVVSLREQGTASDFEVLQARVERDNLEPEVVEAENARQVAHLSLRRLIRAPAGRPLVLATGLTARMVDVDLRTVLEAARDRPSVQAAREQVAVQEALVRAARGERLPTVSAFGNFSYQSFPDRVLPEGLPGGDEWREDFGVGVRLSVPIFEGGALRAGIDAARVSSRRAVLESRLLLQGVELEVAAAFASYEAARARIEARRGTVEQAERALELGELRFETGMATFLEVSSARLALRRARLNEAQALHDYLTALAAIEHATGGRLPLLRDAIAEAPSKPVPRVPEETP